MELVKILIDDDGTEIENPKWHLVEITAGSPGASCTGEYFGEGESGVVFETKRVDRGGITCKDCLAKIKWFKSIKL